jgi:hypothetical protein
MAGAADIDGGARRQWASLRPLQQAIEPFPLPARPTNREPFRADPGKGDWVGPS